MMTLPTTGSGKKWWSRSPEFNSMVMTDNFEKITRYWLSQDFKERFGEKICV